MGRFAVLVLLVVVAACEKEPPQLYTEEEALALVNRALSQVAHDRPGCVHPELAELMTRAPGSDVVAKFHAATATPGCSPFQGRLRLVDPEAPLRSARALLAEAMKHESASDALDEVATGIRACQDLGRGPVEIMVSMRSSACERLLLDPAGALIATRVLTPQQLQHAVTTFDTLLETEPRFGETIIGQIQTMSTSRAMRFHQARDESALTIAADERIAELTTTACPPSASLARCADGLGAVEWSVGSPREVLARHASEIGNATTQAARRGMQNRLEGEVASAYMHRLGVYIARRAVTVAQLASVRLQLQVLRDGRCPDTEELAAPGYAALLAPEVLGDAIVVTRTANALVVEPPPWAQSEQPAPILVKCP